MQKSKALSSTSLEHPVTRSAREEAADHFKIANVRTTRNEDVHMEASPIEEASPISQPNRSLRQEDVKVKNDSWYIKASTTAPPSKKLSVLSGITEVDLAHRALRRHLMERFDLVGRNPRSLQGVDLILSGTTGVIFCQGSDVQSPALIERLKVASRYYTMIYVVFEIVNYRHYDQLQAKGTEPGPDDNDQEALRQVPKFNRSLHVEHMGSVTASVSVGVAAKGAAEVVKVLRNVVDEELATARNLNGLEGALLACEDRRWLCDEEVSY